MYPNRKWLLIGVSRVGETIFPVTGGAPILTHLHPPEWLRWTGDGKHLFVVGANERRADTYILPLSPGEVLPRSISRAKPFPSEAELAKLPGVRTIPVADAVPGATADIYAFTRATVQRNLYRIPLP
jgi:hypothetical protein